MAEPPPTEPAAADFFMAALWDAAQSPEVDVPGYDVLDEISRGGMGVVYHARQLRPEREVALKVLLPEFAKEAEMLARFQLEARAMAALDHPGILPVYEVGDADGMPFFSMKLATGGSLADRLRGGRLPPKESVALMIQLTRAVHHAHQHGVLHRDLKPGNFLFLEDGRACVSDFGLAKLTVSDQRPLTRTESFFGTPHYMPPEVAAGSVADATVAGDLYSMGAVLYECLTGRRPHEARENVAALLRSIADDPIQPPTAVEPHLPGDLSIICMKALERNPSDRYATLEDLADDLERWTEGRPIKARPVGMAEATWRWARRHPLPATLAATLLTVILVGSILLAISNSQLQQQLQRKLIEQARSDRLLGLPGHREKALAQLKQAASLAASPEIGDEAAALFARPDLSRLELDKNPLVEIKPPDRMADDRIVNWRIPPDGAMTLATHESGTVRLWLENETSPAAEWRPNEGGEIIADFTPDRTAVVLAGTEQGVVLEPVSLPGGRRILAGPEPMSQYLSIDPASRKVALGRVDGLEVLDLGTDGGSWHFGDAQARCAAAWSADGSRIAIAVGDRREAVILSAESGAVCATAAVTGLPQHLAFHPGSGLLAIASDDGTISLCDGSSGAIWTTLRFAARSLSFSSDGAELHASGDDGRVRKWPVVQPVAFHEWQEAPRQKADGAVFGMKASPDGKRLLTLSSGCLAVWAVEERRQTGHFLLETQRIDVRPSAWWLDSQTLLVQVPGGLEKLSIDAQGKPGSSTRVPRVPGSSVLDVRPDGWVVSVSDEDGNQFQELWPDGDPDQAKPIEATVAKEPPIGARHESSGLTVSLNDGDVIELRYPDGRTMKLTPPMNPGVKALWFSPDAETLVMLTRTHRVFSWDLDELDTVLKADGL